MEQPLPSVTSRTSSRAPSPNRGQTIDAVDVIPGQHDMNEWRKKNGIILANQVKLVKLSHMWYQHKDFDATTKFLRSEQFISFLMDFEERPFGLI